MYQHHGQYLQYGNNQGRREAHGGRGRQQQQLGNKYGCVCQKIWQNNGRGIQEYQQQQQPRNQHYSYKKIPQNALTMISTTGVMGMKCQIGTTQEPAINPIRHRYGRPLNITLVEELRKVTTKSVQATQIINIEMKGRVIHVKKYIVNKNSLITLLLIRTPATILKNQPKMILTLKYITTKQQQAIRYNIYR